MPIHENILERLRKNDPSLTELDLSNSGLTDADIIALCIALKNNTNLTSLVLLNNKISDTGAQALAESKILSMLNLQHNKIGVVGVQALAKSTTLTTLAISGNLIGEQDAIALAGSATLTTLDLSWTPDPSWTPETKAAIKMMLKYNKERAGLLVPPAKPPKPPKPAATPAPQIDKGKRPAARGITPEPESKIDAEILQRLRSNDPTLTALDLSSRELTDADVIELCNALEKNTSLDTLDLDHNQIGDAGAQALAGSKTLTMLGLGHNQIGDAGAQALAENKTPTVLDLGHNQIGDAGAQALAESKTLTVLDLGHNQIGDAGAKALAENKTLTVLDLEHNQISDAGAKALAKSKTLTVLTLSHNQISDVAQKQVERQLAQNISQANALKSAIQSEDIPRAEALLKKGVRIRAEYIDGKPCFNGGLLHMAVAYRNFKLLSLLLRYSSQFEYHVRNKDGLTFQELAKKIGFSLEGLIPSPNFTTTPTQQINKGKKPAIRATTPQPESKIDAEILQRLRSNDPTLTTLNLSRKDLTDKDILILCQALETNTSLKKLYLEWNQIGDEGAIALARHKEFTTLTFFANNITDIGAKAFKNHHALTTLILQGNPVGAEGLAAIKTMLTLNKAQKIWPGLKWNSPGSEPHEPVAAPVKQSSQIDETILRKLRNNDPSLVELSLTKQKLTDADVLILCEALKKNTAVKTLNLWNNQIGDQGAIALAQNKTLTTLQLGCNKISDAGAKALSLNKSFTTLHLQTNQVGDLGAAALSQSTTLKALDLRKNKITDTGAQAFSQNTTLSTLDLEHNQVGEAAMAEIKAMVQRNRGSKVAQTTVKSVNIQPDTQTFGAWANSAFANPRSQKSLAILNSLSDATLEYIQNLNPSEQDEIKSLLLKLKQQQTVLEETLDPVIRKQRADSNTRQAIRIIEQHPDTKLYFEALLRTMDQTLWAALVIRSGKVEQTPQLWARFLTGVSQAVGLFVPAAAPFVSLLNHAINTADEFSSYRNMKAISSWVLLSDEISHFCLSLAIECTQAKKQEIKGNFDLPKPMQSTLSKLKNNCQALFIQVKSGERFKPAEERAVLDAYYLLSHMMAVKPKNNEQDVKIAQLVLLLTGAPLKTAPRTPQRPQKPGATTNSNSNNNANLNVETAPVGFQAALLAFQRVENEQKARNKELDELKKSFSKTASTTELLAKKVTELEAENKALREKLNEKDKRDNLMGGAGNGSGRQVQAQEIDLTHPDLPQGVAPKEVFVIMYKQTQQQQVQLQAVVEMTTNLGQRASQLEESDQISQSNTARFERHITHQVATAMTKANLVAANMQAETFTRNNGSASKKQ